jgi:phage terminase large subunit
MRRFASAGLVLGPRQLAASAAARDCDRPDGPVEVGYGGARGGGKSHWMLAQLAADDCQRQPGLKALLLRKVGKAGRESFEDLRLRVLARLLHEYKRNDGSVHFPNGSRIILGNFKDERDVDAYLGLEYDAIGIEEATTLSASKVKVVNSCRRTSKPGWRPRTYYTTNPGGVGHAWFKARFVAPHRAGREAETRFIPATARDNRFLNPEYTANLEGLTGWLRRAWLDGDWDIASGQFFTTFRREAHVIPPIAVPDGWRAWLGFDYGFTHYTACHLLAESGDGDLYVVAEHGERRWLIEHHAAAIRAMLDRHGVAPHRLAGVLAGPDVFARKQDGGTIAADYARLPEPIRLHFRPANTDRINGAAAILRRLGDPGADDPARATPPRLFICESCPRLIEALPGLEHDPHRPEDVLKVDCDEDGRGGDDFYDSFRYAVMGAATPYEVRVYA